LRTTLSRLRRAIGEASGGDPERYLRVDANVALVLDHVVVDARRFAEHVELGRLDDARGELDSARRHYRIATGIYKNHLLMSEAIEPSLLRHVKHYEASFEATLTRMVALSGGDEHGGERRTLSRRLAAMSGTA
jgi:DNA-binding SARP family transcriptional activator